MTRLTENRWVVDWSLVTIMGNTMPPRDPNDDDDDEGQDEEHEDEDEEDEDEHDEPAVIREPRRRISGPRDPYIFALAVAVALTIGVLVVSIAWPDMLPWAQKARVVSR